MITSFTKHWNLKIITNLIFMSYGTIIGPLIVMAVQPILKNTYEPSVFGMLELYTRLTGILLVVFTLKYEISIVNENTEQRAINMLHSIFIFGSILLIILETIIYFSQNVIIDYFIIPKEYTFIIYLIPLSAFFLMLTKILFYALIRGNMFNQTSITKIGRRGIEALSQIKLKKTFNNYGLLLGEMLGNIASSVFMIFMLRKKLFKHKIEKLSYYLSLMKENKNIPIYVFPSDLLNVAVNSFLIILFVRNFGFESTGFLELSLKILIIPAALLTASIGPIVLQTVSRSREEKKQFYSEIIVLTTLSIAVGIFFSLSLFLWIENLLSYFFSDEWSNSIIYCKILIYPTVVQLIVSPLGQILVGLKCYKLDAILKFIKFSVLSLMFFIVSENETELLVIYSALTIVFYVIYGLVVYYKSREYHRSIILKNA
jgi:O-antigen/teichoic acid export membrane protein